MKAISNLNEGIKNSMEDVTFNRIKGDGGHKYHQTVKRREHNGIN